MGKYKNKKQQVVKTQTNVDNVRLNNCKGKHGGKRSNSTTHITHTLDTSNNIDMYVADDILNCIHNGNDNNDDNENNDNTCSSVSSISKKIESQQTHDKNTLMDVIKSLFYSNDNVRNLNNRNKWIPTWLPSWKKTPQPIYNPIITNLKTSTSADVILPSEAPKMMPKTMRILTNSHSDSHRKSSTTTTSYIKRKNSTSSTSSETSMSTGNRKKRIPKTVRREVWEKVHGSHAAKGKCYVSWCPRILDKMDFQAGHNIPESKGGTIDLDNLFPICNDCNQGMGDRFTIDEWSDMAFMTHVRDDFINYMPINEWEKVGQFVRRIVKLHPSILYEQ